MKKNKDIEEAVVTVHEMSEDEKLRRLAELREKAIMDEKAIRKAGYVHGMEDEKIKIAKKLKEKGNSVDEIKEITGLSEEEINKL